MPLHRTDLPAPDPAQRAAINAGILNMIRSGRNPDPAKVLAGYTGKGGLHGLAYKDFANRHEYSRAKQDFEEGQFFTPAGVASLLVSMVSPDRGWIACDPTCGSGSMLNALDSCVLYGCEVDPDAATVATYLFPSARITNEDVRAYKPDARFDLVIGNPPFGLRWLAPGNPASNERGEASSEDVFLSFAATHLKPGGTLALVCPAGWLTDSLLHAKGRDLAVSHFVAEASVLLRESTFSASGADKVSTKLLILRGRLPGEDGSLQGAELDARSLSHEDVLSWWSGPAGARYRAFRASLSRQRAALIRNEVRSAPPPRDEAADSFRLYLHQLRRFDPAAARKQEARWREANAPKPLGIPFDTWEATRLKPSTVARETRQLVRKEHRRPIHEVRFSRSPKGIWLHGTSRMASAALRTLRTEWSWSDIAAGQTPDTKEVLQSIMALNSRPKARAQIVPRFQNFRKAVKKTRNTFALWTAPLVADPQNLAAARAAYSELARRSPKVIRMEEVQIREIASVLPKPGALLAWQMGCGKTLGALAWNLAKGSQGSTLLVGPALALRMNWASELASLGFSFAEASAELLTSETLPDFILVTHHGLVRHKRTLRTLAARGQFARLIADESDEFANRSSGRSRALLALAPRIPARLLLTGTPARNTASELFCQFQAIMGSTPAFRCVARTLTEWCPQIGDLLERPNPRRGEPYTPFKGLTLFRKAHAPVRPTVLGADRPVKSVYAADELRGFLATIRSRITIAELRGSDPAEIETSIASMSEPESQQYREYAARARQAARDLMDAKPGDERKLALLSIASSIRLLQQFTSRNGSAKRRMIEAHVENSPASHLAIGTLWRDTASDISHSLGSGSREVFLFDGEASFARRTDILRAFAASPRAALVTTQGSLRSSVNVSCVSEVVAEALPWNFPALEQYFRRFVRYSSDADSVKVTLAVTKDTIEEPILGLLLKKDNVARLAAGEDFAPDHELFAHYGIDAQALHQLAHYLLGQGDSVAAPRLAA